VTSLIGFVLGALAMYLFDFTLCPKCVWPLVEIEWCSPAKRARHLGDGMWAAGKVCDDEKVVEEHFHRRCRRCLYLWRDSLPQKTADRVQCVCGAHILRANWQNHLTRRDGVHADSANPLSKLLVAD
jgi:hypothetical protein